MVLARIANPKSKKRFGGRTGRELLERYWARRSVFIQFLIAASYHLLNIKYNLNQS